MTVDYFVMAAYLLGIIGVGWWGKKRAASKSDFLVAGRRLGPLMYTGTMAAVVLGGASTIGGVRLGYTYGISGAAMVFAIGLGLLALRSSSPPASPASRSTPSPRCSPCATATPPP
jgi:SSS family solute:Na+ symporter